MSPSDLGGIVKPFVFLDRFESDGAPSPVSMEQGWHPHSGIATVTVITEGSVQFSETTGQSGVLPAGSVEWMQAGNGVWHTGAPGPDPLKGFQLWVALPPELENAPSLSRYVMPEDVPVEGPARVILGSYGAAKSPIDSPPMNYLAVSLKDGERWTYQPPKGHGVAWVALGAGGLSSPGSIESGEMAVFDASEDPLDFVATGTTMFMLGSAPPHPYELALGNYSVHTSANTLRRGQQEIRRIGQGLRGAGKDSHALRHEV